MKRLMVFLLLPKVGHLSRNVRKTQLDADTKNMWWPAYVYICISISINNINSIFTYTSYVIYHEYIIHSPVVLVVFLCMLFMIYDISQIINICYLIAYVLGICPKITCTHIKLNKKHWFQVVQVKLVFFLSRRGRIIHFPSSRRLVSKEQNCLNLEAPQVLFRLVPQILWLLG